MPRKKSPQDLTLRNLRALKKLVTTEKKALARLATRVDKFSIHLGNHEARLRLLEKPAKKARG